MNERPHPAAVDVAGAWYLRDAKNSLVPIGAVKAVDLLIDELVRTELDEALTLSAAIGAFKQRSFARVGELQALLAQDYGATVGGARGNITLTSYDGRAQVTLFFQELIRHA